MAKLKWTRTYDLSVDGCNFRIALSEQLDGIVNATCLWYKKGRALKAPGQNSVLAIQSETQTGSNEHEALGKITAWAESNFDNVGELVLDEEKHDV